MIAPNDIAIDVLPGLFVSYTGTGNVQIRLDNSNAPAGSYTYKISASIFELA